MSGVLSLVASPASSEILIASVVGTLSSPKTQRAYREALREFVAWTADCGEPLTKPFLETWRAALLARGLSVSSVNQKLSAVRLLLRQAAERGALTLEEATRLASVANLKQTGARHGKWLTEREAGQLLAVPNIRTTIGIRDRALLALLLACGLRRDELVRLEIRHLQRREDRWVLLDFVGKGRRTRTVAVPHWVRRILEVWLDHSGIAEGFLFRTVPKGGNKIGPNQALSEDAIYSLVKSCGAAIGHPDLAPHDLRRTCAKLCRKAGGDLEQIQFLLGHASIKTTQTYLGTEQDLVQAVNDRMRIRIHREE